MGGSSGKHKKKQSRITEQDKAVLELKKQRDRLKQYQKKISVQLEKDRHAAKQLLSAGKKDKAKLLLRKKKFQETMLSKTDGQLSNIEQMVHDLEFAQIEAKVMAGLQAGNEALKKMHQILSIEDVETIMGETQEAVEYQQEIDSILAGGLTQQDEVDVLQELEDIIQESIPSPPAGDKDDTIELPDVPQDQIQQGAQRTKVKKEAVIAT